MDRVKPAPKGKINLDGIAGLLFGLHLGLANIFGEPRLMLAEAEYGALAHAMANVWRHFENAIPSPLLMDCGALVSTCVGIYLPRFVPQAALAMALAQQMAAQQKTGERADDGDQSAEAGE